MCLGKERSVSCVREILTERVRCFGMFLAAAKTARRRFPVSRPLRPAASASGMNSSGGIRPRRGCCQRAKTSKPPRRPVRSSTSGWKYGMISFFSSALRRSFASSAAMVKHDTTARRQLIQGIFSLIGHGESLQGIVSGRQIVSIHIDMSGELCRAGRVWCFRGGKLIPTTGERSLGNGR